MRKIYILSLMSLFLLSLFVSPVEAKIAPKAKARPLSVIKGELSGIGPALSELNIKSASKWFDYTILLDKDTVFLDRNGEVTNLDGFGFGDRVEARGIIEKPYILRAKTVRDLNAWKVPAKQTTLVIENSFPEADALITVIDKKEWHIKIQPQTVVMDKNGNLITINDLDIDEAIYVAGIWNQDLGTIFASVIQQKQ